MAEPRLPVASVGGKVKAAALCALGTATPSASLDQNVAMGLAATRCCRSPRERHWIEGLYSASGVRRRGSVLLEHDDDVAAMAAFYPPPISVDDRGPTTAARLARYELEAGALAAQACAAAFNKDAELEPEAITHVVTVSCTGLFSPGLDAQLIARLGLAHDVGRLNLGFMGCHGAFNGLLAAAALAHSTEHARVLLCCVELCSLHFHYGWNRQQMVANALFADGAAAAILAPTDASRLQVIDTASLLIPESTAAMTWRIGDHGFEMGLSPEIPRRIRASLRSWLEPWLTKHHLSISDIAHWVIHPGGPSIVDAAIDALGVAPVAGEDSRAILAEHGNMSSPTVLFILERMHRQGKQPPIVALGFGPGLMFEAALLA